MPIKQYTVRWLKLALQDMGEIAEYISRDDPEKACEIAREIWDSSQSLRTLPTRGKIGRVPGTREFVLAKLPFFIAFRVKGNTVQILRVIHTSRQVLPGY